MEEMDKAPGMQPIRALYLHVPFCTWVCKYCDFNAYPVLQGFIAPYVEALCKEIGASAARYPVGRLRSVFFGGGTPSLLSREQLAAIMQTISREIGIEPGGEVTLEANPSNVKEESAAKWLELGINRLSIGVQSLDEGALRFLERLHSGREAIQAICAAQRAGFANISADLLYGIPGISTARWMETLDRLLEQALQHLSSYELTVEPGTRLAQEVSRGLVTMPGAEEQLEQYWAADARLALAGFHHYEISNWAMAGYESRHNLAYWQYEPYLGCGAGAHSMFRTENGAVLRSWNLKGPRRYIETVRSTGHAVESSELLDAERAAGEAAMVGIRLLQGTTATAPFVSETKMLREAGLLTRDAVGERLTRRGVELANQVGAAFLRPA